MAFSRRRLLLLAGAGAAGLAVGYSPAARRLGGSSAAGSGSNLAVGFLEGSGELASLRAAPWQSEGASRRVVPAPGNLTARSAVRGDAVDLRVHGFTPGVAPGRFDAGTTAVLSVLFASHDAAHPEPFMFHAWQGMLSGHEASQPIQFPVPLDPDGAVALQLDVFTPGATGSGERFTATFGDGAAPLDRGSYLLGLVPGQWRHGPTLATTKAVGRRPYTALAISLDAPAD